MRVTAEEFATLVAPSEPTVALKGLSGGTKIEWADFTFNPWWGCTHVSPACDFCYAEAHANRFAKGLWEKDGPRRFFDDGHWADPVKWDRKAERHGVRYKVFCASMADVFEDHDELESHRQRLWELIEATPHLIWLLLTKRPQHVMSFVPGRWRDGLPENVWVGTTVESQRYANIRIPHLVKVPARVRFLSCEPLFEPLDLSRWLGLEWMDALRTADEPRTWRTEDGNGGWGAELFTSFAGVRPSIQWVITGGESGLRARPSHVGWFRDLMEQCRAADVPFLFKQHGQWCPWPNVESGDYVHGASDEERDLACLRERIDLGHRNRVHYWEDGTQSVRIGKVWSGRMLDGRTFDEVPS